MLTPLAVEDGGRNQLHMAIGNNLGGQGQQLDIEEMMERALTMIGGERPELLTAVDWHVASLGVCRNRECGRLDSEMCTAVPCNPIALRPENEDSSQEMVNRMMAAAGMTPQPCPDCSQDMEPKGAEFGEDTPHILVVHARRARHDGTRDTRRVDFEDRIHIQQVWYKLIAVSQCTYPEGDTSAQGGHYMTYRRRHGGTWALHNDMYVAGEAPVLDDPANTTA